MEDWIVHTTFLSAKLNRPDHLRDLDVDGRRGVILKWILKNGI
jgi:hypothetical protein